MFILILCILHTGSRNGYWQSGDNKVNGMPLFCRNMCLSGTEFYPARTEIPQEQVRPLKRPTDRSPRVEFDDMLRGPSGNLKFSQVS